MTLISLLKNLNREIILTVACYLAAGVLAVTAVYPAMVVLAAEYRQWQTEREELAVLTQKASDLTNFSEARFRSLLAVGISAVPTEKETFGVATALETLAATTGGRLVNFSLKNEGALLIAEVEGSIAVVGDFLERLYRARRILAVERLDYDKGSAILQMKMYSRPIPASLEKISLPLEELTEEEEKALAEAGQFSLLTTDPGRVPAGGVLQFGP